MTCGEDGMDVTNNEKFANSMREVRAHGWTKDNLPLAEEFDLDPRYVFSQPGYNMRPTELQAGFGLAQLDKVQDFNTRRCELMEQFKNGLDKELMGVFSLPVELGNTYPVPFSIPLRVNRECEIDRADVMDYLEEHGVETRPLVAGNLARQPFAKLEYLEDMFKGDFPGADAIHNECFFMGLNPMFNSEYIVRLLDTLHECIITLKRS